MIGSILTELIPLALVVALSPLSIIPAVLVLHTPRPRPTGLAFLVGWLLGLTVLTAIFLQLSSLVGGLGTARRLGVVAAHRRRRRADRVRRLPLADAQEVRAHAGLDDALSTLTPAKAGSPRRR